MTPRPVPGGDAGGPLVALCAGHRCAGLRRLAGSADAVDRVAEAVRHTSGAVLVTTGCVGACDRAAVAGLARRAPGTGQPGPAVWLTEVQSAERTAGLVAWVAAGGPVLPSGVPSLGPPEGGSGHFRPPADGVPALGE